MPDQQLEEAIEHHFGVGPAAIGDPLAMQAFLELQSALERGEVGPLLPIRRRQQGGASTLG